MIVHSVKIGSGRLMQKLKMTMDATGKVLKSGMKMTSEVAKAERLAVCATCSHFFGKKCAVCGCNMIIKSAFHATCCPEDKWP